MVYEGMPLRWEQLYPKLKIMYICYKHPADSITIREILATNDGFKYKQIYDVFERLTYNGYLKRERPPREGPGGRPVAYCISERGIRGVQAFISRGIYKDEYPEEYWKLGW